MCRKLAVILAGGKGTRLRPYTLALPKPLVPVGERAILEIVLMQLAGQGFTDIYIAVNHQAELIEAYFGRGDKLGLKICYFFEEKPLGTMGPLRNMEDLPEDFLVMNGDILSDINYADFLQRHIEQQAVFTISAYERLQMVDYGVLEIKDRYLQGFKEKPSLKYDVSMGIYAVNRKALQYIPVNTFFGFDHLMGKLLTERVPVRVDHFDGYWMDIGRPEDYEQAVTDIETGKFSV